MQSSSALKVGSPVADTVAISSGAKQSRQRARRSLQICTLAATASLMACAAVDEPRYALKDGWRAARIDEVGPASTLRQVTSEDCRAAATVQRETARFAVVSYWSTVPSRRYPSGWFPRIVPLDAASTLNVGDPVYVNILDCAAPLMTRNDRS